MNKLFKLLLICLIVPFTIFANYELSICSIFQNEAPFLKEWIEFHKLQGVEHFYLYNNNSTDKFRRVIKPYIKSNVVTLVEWPYTYEQGHSNDWLAIQRGAYDNCLKNYGKTSNWIAFIDADEFLFCPHGEKIPSFLEQYKEFGGVCVNWLLFGTSNVQNIPDGTLMIELLTKCGKFNNVRHVRVKSIVQPKFTDHATTAHSFAYKKGYVGVGVNKNEFEGGNSPYVTHDKLRINHYWTRTEEWFAEKKIKSRHNRRNEENEINLQVLADSYNLSTNEEILQFVPALRAQMGYK